MGRINYEEFIGKKFNKLTVLGFFKKPTPTEKRPSQKIPYFKCECECGNIKDIPARGILKGETKSCGCFKKDVDKKHLNMVGKKFNKLTVLEAYKKPYPEKNNPNTKRCFFKCRCECGNIKEIMANSVIRNKVKSCGCLNKEIDKKFIDSIGVKFNKLTIREIYRKEINKGNKIKTVVFAKCECECGEFKELRAITVISGSIKSCGCLSGENHGETRTRLHRIWGLMKDRCLNENNKNYNRYGGRGISICTEWENSYLSFKEWAINNGYNDELTLDRIDFNGNYEPSNCRWVTIIEQQNNKRNNIYLTHNGETKTLAQWCDIYDANRETIKRRIAKGLTFEQAFDKNLNKHLYNGKYMSLEEIARLNNISPITFGKRIKKGMSIEEAINYKRYDYFYDGEYRSLNNIAKINNISYTTFKNRVDNHNDTIEEAIKYCKDNRLEKHLYNGEYLSLKNIAKLNNIHPDTFRRRIRKGMTIEEAINYKR